MATSSRYLLTPQQRLRTRVEFQRVQAQGNPFYSRYFTVLFYVEPGAFFSRLGILTSRRYGKASERSRIRRLIRETFRLYQHAFNWPCDIIVIPKSNAQKLKNDLLRDDLTNIWKKADFLKH